MGAPKAMDGYLAITKLCPRSLKFSRSLLTQFFAMSQPNYDRWLLRSKVIHNNMHGRPCFTRASRHVKQNAHWLLLELRLYFSRGSPLMREEGILCGTGLEGELFDSPFHFRHLKFKKAVEGTLILR